MSDPFASCAVAGSTTNPETFVARTGTGTLQRNRTRTTGVPFHDLFRNLREIFAIYSTATEMFFTGQPALTPNTFGAGWTLENRVTTDPENIATGNMQSGTHLRRCLFYIDMNRVRAKVVDHPVKWKHSSAYELAGSRQRVTYAVQVQVAPGLTRQVAERQPTLDTARG